MESTEAPKKPPCKVVVAKLHFNTCYNMVTWSRLGHGPINPLIGSLTGPSLNKVSYGSKKVRRRWHPAARERARVYKRAAITDALGAKDNQDEPQHEQGYCVLLTTGLTSQFGI